LTIHDVFQYNSIIVIDIIDGKSVCTQLMKDKIIPHFQKSDRSDKSDWSDLSDLSDFTEWENYFQSIP